MKTTVKLDVAGMVGFLMTIGQSSMFLSMETATPFKLNKFDRGAKGNKKPCPWSSVTKLAVRTGWLNIDYKKAVERRIAKLTGLKPEVVDYKLGEVWHKHLLTEDGKTTPVLRNDPDDGKRYIFYFHRQTKAARYVGPDGKPIAYEDMKPWMPPPRAFDAAKPPVRSITLNNVRVLKARGLIVRGA